jgi:hypothetical protein
VHTDEIEAEEYAQWIYATVAQITCDAFEVPSADDEGGTNATLEPIGMPRCAHGLLRCDVQPCCSAAKTCCGSEPRTAGGGTPPFWRPDAELLESIRTRCVSGDRLRDLRTR